MLKDTSGKFLEAFIVDSHPLKNSIYVVPYERWSFRPYEVSSLAEDPGPMTARLMVRRREGVYCNSYSNTDVRRNRNITRMSILLRSHLKATKTFILSGFMCACGYHLLSPGAGGQRSWNVHHDLKHHYEHHSRVSPRLKTLVRLHIPVL